MDKTKKLVSLNELAKIADVNKTKLSFYAKSGLFLPVQVVGRMQIFDMKETLKTLKLIEKKQEEGKSLTEIKEELNN